MHPAVRAARGSREGWVVLVQHDIAFRLQALLTQDGQQLVPAQASAWGSSWAKGGGGRGEGAAAQHAGQGRGQQRSSSQACCPASKAAADAPDSGMRPPQPGEEGGTQWGGGAAQHAPFPVHDGPIADGAPELQGSCQAAGHLLQVDVWVAGAGEGVQRVLAGHDCSGGGRGGGGGRMGCWGEASVFSVYAGGRGSGMG